MRQGRDYWSRRVAAWRRSGQSKKAYYEKHDVSYWSLRHWAAKLAAPATPATPEGQRLVELERVGGREPGAAIELVVGERYLLRLWPNVRAALWRDNQGEKRATIRMRVRQANWRRGKGESPSERRLSRSTIHRATIRMRIDVATEPRVA